jgi:hypothetical protein
LIEFRAVEGSGSGSALNDVLRIGYNFASDATGYLRLIVSVCDLKPIVLWGTISEQSIADARNNAFHNLFPFQKSLRVPLPEAALGEPQLQIFSEHAKKSNNPLTYKDKELVDVLMDFSRAREQSLSITFWEKDLDVMNATISLFQRTNEFIRVHAETRRATENLG